MQLQLKTWTFVEDYLKTKTGIIIPIGSTEQHGPTGLIGTDALTAEMIGRGAGEKAGALVAPTISVGMAQHHLGFPGSVTLRPTTLIAVVRDTVMSLARHGFTRFFFVNGHGGNIATVTAAFSEIYADRSMEKLSNQPSVKCALRNWWDGAGIKALQKELYPSGEGATPPPRKWRSPGTNIPRRSTARSSSRASHRTARSPMPRIIAAPSPTAASAPIPARRRPSTASASMTPPSRKWRAITRGGWRGRPSLPHEVGRWPQAGGVMATRLALMTPRPPGGHLPS